MTSPLRVLLVGCGGISRSWLEPLTHMAETKLVGLVDVNKTAADARAAEFGLSVPTSSDLETMLHELQPDLVCDCTIPEAHYGVTLAALAAGAHIFGEKPMADTVKQAEQMVAAAKASGKTYAVMQNRRYDPNIRALKAFLDEGVIGELTELHADFYIGAHFGGFREKMPHALIKDMAIHTVDAARFLSGARPKSVYCLEWNPKGSWYERDASATAVFELSDGIVFTYRGSWCAEGLHTPWESQWRIVGTKGTVLWNGTEIRCEVVGKASGFISEHLSVTPPTPAPAQAMSWHAAAIDAFVAAIREGKTPETVCYDNLHSLTMVLGAVASAEARRVVDLEKALARTLP